MSDYEAGKVTGIRQIVRLKEIIQKWQSITLSHRGNSGSPSDNKSRGGISPDVTNYTICDSDEESCHSPCPESPPLGVPKGYLAVYVGPELRRFIIPTTYLTLPVFKVLLEKVEEEFGFEHKGGLTIPCEIETFKYLLNCMDNYHKEHPDADDHNNAEETPSTVEE
uniref:Uncharacterized protein n=1 Tax=Nelumbo nucifera TaxID=4432 RepID=A0A822ZMJ4_NELNU|nr:TPA_asm: hypothetical protein HUJ06_002406 [Nelumbo nucifera]